MCERKAALEYEFLNTFNGFGLISLSIDSFSSFCPFCDTHTDTHPAHLPSLASRVKCYSLLVVTVANHLTFRSNCFQGNREIWLPGTKSNACDCYLFIYFYLYLFVHSKCVCPFFHMCILYAQEIHTHTHVTVTPSQFTHALTVFFPPLVHKLACQNTHTETNKQTDRTLVLTN